jgi:hypothetical protein
LLKYCMECRAEIPAGLDICPNCRAISAKDTSTPVSQPIETQLGPLFQSEKIEPHSIASNEPEYHAEQDSNEAPPSPSRTSKILAGLAAGLLLGLAVLYYFIFIHDDVSTSGGTPTSSAPVQSAPAVQTVSLYAVTKANIRDKPTTTGSTIVGTLPRGSIAEGSLILGENGSDNWLKLSDGSGFISAVNLSEEARPKLVKELGDKVWKSDQAADIWSAPSSSSELLDRVGKDAPLTLVGLTENDYIEIKLRSGGVGYIAGGARIIALLNAPVAETITMNFRPDTCSFGGGVEALFTQLSSRADAKRTAIANQDYPDPDARQAALEAYDQKQEGRSSFEKLNRSYNGLTITGIGIHYESQSVYFAETPAQVIAAFKQKGFNINSEGSFKTTELYAGIGPSAKQDRSYGAAELSCGV